MPPFSSPNGKTYGEWAAAWWQRIASIPVATNPNLDETGEFQDIDQEGGVWFLAGTFGGSAERSVTIPPGTKLFFPIINTNWWAPDDVEFAAELLAAAGYPVPEDDLEKIRAIARLGALGWESLEMKCTVDDVDLSRLETYYTESPDFRLDTTFIGPEGLGIPIAEENTAVTAGYYIMLAPLKPGEHTVFFSADGDNGYGGALGEEDGDFALSVTYHINVSKNPTAPEDNCENIDDRKECKAAGCHWKKKNVPKCSGGESYEALSNIKEADAKAEQPSTGYALAAVSAWSLVPMLILLKL